MTPPRSTHEVPTPKKKKPADRYHHGDLRNALIAQAWAIVDKRGQSALSMRAVAEALGVSHGAPAHHFADKKALMCELRLQAWRDFANALESAGEGPDALRHMGRAYVSYVLAHPRRVELIFRSSDPSTPAAQAQSMRAWAALSNAVLRHIGPARAADARLASVLCVAAWAQAHGLAMLWTDVSLPPGLPQGAAAQQLHEAALDVLYAGMTAVLGPVSH
jgi:AcrR family transcriptional regulator